MVGFDQALCSRFIRLSWVDREQDICKGKHYKKRGSPNKVLSGYEYPRKVMLNQKFCTQRLRDT